MPFALVIIGVTLIVVGFQNTYKQLGNQIVKDFTGEGNFLYWLAALGIVGSVGYFKPVEGFSRLFMGLIILGLFLSNKGQTGQSFFTNLTQGLKSGSEKINLPIGEPLPQGGAGGTGGSGGGGGLGSIGDIFGGGDSGDGGFIQDAGTIAEIASFF